MKQAFNSPFAIHMRQVRDNTTDCLSEPSTACRPGTTQAAFAVNSVPQTPILAVFAPQTLTGNPLGGASQDVGAEMMQNRTGDVQCSKGERLARFHEHAPKMDLCMLLQQWLHQVLVAHRYTTCSHSPTRRANDAAGQTVFLSPDTACQKGCRADSSPLIPSETPTHRCRIFTLCSSTGCSSTMRSLPAVLYGNVGTCSHTG